MPRTKPPAEVAPARIQRGSLVEVAEENRRPFRGLAMSVKHSSVSGWWVEVKPDDGGVCLYVPEDVVEVVSTHSPGGKE